MHVMVGWIVINFAWIISHRYDIHKDIGVRINHKAINLKLQIQLLPTTY